MTKWQQTSDVNPYSDRHSVPLDVGLYSPHPEVDEFIDEICRRYTPEYMSKKRGRKGYDDPTRRAMRCLILHLYQTWRTDPTLYTGMPFTKQAYKKGRLNKIHVSYRVVEVAKALINHGLLTKHGGYHNGAEGRVTRVRPTQLMHDIFEDRDMYPEMIRPHPTKSEVLFLYKDGKSVEYTDSRMTNHLRQEVQAYNDMMSRHHVGIFNRENDWSLIEYESDGKKYQTKVPTDQSKKYVVRIFNDDFMTGGRTYRHWPVQVHSEERKNITIDGWYSVEVDFSAMHPAMLYAEEGIRLQQDPYASPADLPGWGRDCAKVVMNAAINARTIDSALQGAQKSIRDKLKKRFTIDEVRYGLDHVTAANEPISSYLCSDMGRVLQAFDSTIMWGVLSVLTKRDIPAIPIHDSVIVRVQDEELIWPLLDKAYEQVTGQRPYALDDDTDKQLFDADRRKLVAMFEYMVTSHPDVTDGYKQRLDRFMELNVKNGNPDYRAREW